MPAEGDTVAVIGENRKMLVFPLEEVNEMTRGKGVRLQRYKDGGLSDVRVFKKAEGLTWLDPAGRTFTLPYAELQGVDRRACTGRPAGARAASQNRTSLGALSEPLISLQVPRLPPLAHCRRPGHG